MTFIVEQQAKFETDIAKINEALTRLNDTSRIQSESIRGLVEVSRLKSERTDRLDQGLAEMVEAHNRLARAQEETDRRLADFIAQVSRHLAGGNGRQRATGEPGPE